MEKSVFDNGFFEFVEAEEEFVIDGQQKKIKRKMVRRPPGIRALIVNKDTEQILLSREYRYELGDWDYRLPGGKVFDSLKDYKASIARGDVLEHVEKTVSKEVLEEVGVCVYHPKLYKVSHDGAGCIWDLYYYIITEYEVNEAGAFLEEDEVVEGFVFKTFDEVIQMCLTQEIHEDRTVGVLLSYIFSQKNR